MIVLAINAMPLVAKRLFSLGIKGYITKNCSIEEMMEAIEEVHAGNIYLEKNILELLHKKEMLSTGDERWQLLSSREVEVVYAVREGLTSKEIALLLDITMKTVEVHRNNIMRKLGVRNTAALVNLTYAKGI
jgi:DNA-binding NarL/FixJ family response regulator